MSAALVMMAALVMLAGCTGANERIPLDVPLEEAGASGAASDQSALGQPSSGQAPFVGADSEGFVAEPEFPSATGWPTHHMEVRPEVTVDPITGVEQENSLMKWDEWPANAHLKAALYKAQPSPLMYEKYGDAMKVVAYDAALAMAIAHVGLPDLYSPRDGEESQYYEPIRPYVTDSLWEGLETRIDQGVAGESFEIGSFAPQTDRNGLWAVIDGTPYYSTGKTSLEVTGIPRLMMQGPFLSVSFEIQVTGHAKPADIQYDSVYTAVMEFTGTQWLMSGWNNLVTSEIEILEAGKPRE